MPALLSNRLAKQLQREVESSMYTDAANILVDTVSSLDAYGQPVVTTASTRVSCNFTDRPTAIEKWTEIADIEQIEAEVRYNSTTVPLKGNRVTIVKRFEDETFTDTTYEIIGIRDRGALGFVCALRKVQV